MSTAQIFGENTELVALTIGAVYLLAAYNVTRAIRGSRTPQGATAWSIAIIVMPFLVLPLYWIFGRRKFHGYVEAHRNVNEEIREESEHILAEIAESAADPPEGLAPLFTELPDYPMELIAREKFKITPEMLKNVMNKAIEVVEGMDWERGDGSQNEMISNAFMGIVDSLELKNGQVLWPIRVALSGLERSPNFATLAVYLGKEEVLKRLAFALEKVV